MRGPDLTSREWQYLELIADGLTHAQIGVRLKIYPGSVQNTVARIQKRWGARSTIHLIHLAWQKGYFNHLAAYAPPGGLEPPTSGLTGPHSAN